MSSTPTSQPSPVPPTLRAQPPPIASSSTPPPTSPISRSLFASPISGYSPSPPRESPVRSLISWRAALENDYKRLQESHDHLALRVARLEELFIGHSNTYPPTQTFSELSQLSSHLSASLQNNAFTQPLHEPAIQSIALDASQPGFDFSSDYCNHQSLLSQVSVPTMATTTSDNIGVNKLVPISEVLVKYPKLLTMHKAPTLAVKLARLSVFGDSLMAQSTVMGCPEYAALPKADLQDIKQTVLTQFPVYWGNPIEFEPLWVSCLDAIGQACKRLRRNRV